MVESWGLAFGGCWLVVRCLAVSGGGSALKVWRSVVCSLYLVVGSWCLVVGSLQLVVGVW